MKNFTKVMICLSLMQTYAFKEIRMFEMEDNTYELKRTDVPYSSGSGNLKWICQIQDNDLVTFLNATGNKLSDADYPNSDISKIIIKGIFRFLGDNKALNLDENCKAVEEFFKLLKDTEFSNSLSKLDSYRQRAQYDFFNFRDWAVITTVPSVLLDSKTFVYIMLPALFLTFAAMKYLFNFLCVKNISYDGFGTAWVRSKRVICWIPNWFYAPIQNSEFVLFEKRKNLIALMMLADIDISLLEKSFEKNEYLKIDENISKCLQSI